ncbi:hypothetical protein KAZ66_04655 [Candidatus Woesebacteria bacterium]|nr:hypothetical protein [Candidatus Woesebacteria bacterium]
MPRQKEEDELIEDKSISFMVYFKGFFLLALVFVGMFMINRLSEKPSAKEPAPVHSATQKSLVSLKNTAETYMKEHVQKEGLYKSLENTSGQVMGEATAAADLVVEKATDTVADYLYKHTLEVVVVTLIEKFPERQKDLFIKRYCEDHTCK